MIAIRGGQSRIAMELVWLIADRDDKAIIGRNEEVPLGAERYLFCQGLLRSKPIGEQTPEEISEAFAANAANVIRECDAIIAINDAARICVIGSESAFTWSHDGTYAAAKAALHRYVETKRLRTPQQQLICVAPSIVLDAGMTIRRHDQETVAARAAAHPKGRLLRSLEVAKLVHHCLYVDEGYLSGVVIRMNGGQHTSCG